MANLKYQIRKEASERFGKESSFGNEKNSFIEGGDFIIDFIKENFNSVFGNFWECENCNSEIFIPNDECGDYYEYCPQCGERIRTFNGVYNCSDDDFIGIDFKKIR